MEYSPPTDLGYTEALPLRDLVTTPAERDRILTPDQVRAIGRLCAQLELQVFPIGMPLEAPIEAFVDQSEVLRPYAITEDDFKEFARLSDGRHTNKAECGAWNHVRYTKYDERRTPTDRSSPTRRPTNRPRNEKNAAACATAS